jgi:type II secretory pathway pseudopilin PulG
MAVCPISALWVIKAKEIINNRKGSEMRKMNNKGFSLVEIAVAVGLIALLVGTVAAGGGMMNRCRVQREAEAVENLRLASQNYLSGQQLTYAGITVDALKTAGLLPITFDPIKANSFGGDYVVSANADTTRVDIALASVPEAQGAEISAIFKGKAEAVAYDKTTKVWRATF